MHRECVCDTPREAEDCVCVCVCGCCVYVCVGRAWWGLLLDIVLYKMKGDRMQSLLLYTNRRALANVMDDTLGSLDRYFSTCPCHISFISVSAIRSIRIRSSLPFNISVCLLYSARTLMPKLCYVFGCWYRCSCTCFFFPLAFHWINEKKTESENIQNGVLDGRWLINYEGKMKMRICSLITDHRHHSAIDHRLGQNLYYMRW